MQWSDRGRSSDLEDRRGGGGGFGGLLGLPLMLLSGRMGLGGIVLFLVLAFFFRGNFLSLIGGGAGTTQDAARPVNDPAEEPKVRFVSFVLDDVQQTWDGVFQQRGGQYPHAHLV